MDELDPPPPLEVTPTSLQEAVRKTPRRVTGRETRVRKAGRKAGRSWFRRLI